MSQHHQGHQEHGRAFQSIHHSLCGCVVHPSIKTDQKGKVYSLDLLSAGFRPGSQSHANGGADNADSVPAGSGTAGSTDHDEERQRQPRESVPYVIAQECGDEAEGGDHRQYKRHALNFTSGSRQFTVPPFRAICEAASCTDSSDASDPFFMRLTESSLRATVARTLRVLLDLIWATRTAAGSCLQREGCRPQGCVNQGNAVADGKHRSVDHQARLLLLPPSRPS